MNNILKNKMKCGFFLGLFSSTNIMKLLNVDRESLSAIKIYK